MNSEEIKTVLAVNVPLNRYGYILDPVLIGSEASHSLAIIARDVYESSIHCLKEVMSMNIGMSSSTCQPEPTKKEE